MRNDRFTAQSGTRWSWLVLIPLFTACGPGGQATLLQGDVHAPPIDACCFQDCEISLETTSTDDIEHAEIKDDIISDDATTIQDPGTGDDALEDLPRPTDAQDSVDTADLLELPPLADLPAVTPLPGDFVTVDGEHFVVRAHHVRYKQDGETWVDHANFPFWGEQDVSESSREAMYLAEVWRPAAGAIRQVLMLAAGQQGTTSFTGAHPNIVTGQMDGWRPDGDKTLANAEIPIRRWSVAGRIIEDGMWHGGAQYGFVPDDTLLLLMFDAGFNYLLSAETKQAVIDAYVAWMLDRLAGSAAGLRRIVLAGTSRGGCLSVCLARDVAQDSRFGAVLIRIATFDGVCRPSQNEAGTVSEDPVDNPLRPTFKAYRTDLADYFSASALPRIEMWQVIGGGPVIDLGPLDVAHAFIDTHVTIPDPVYGFDYTYSWVPHSHEEIGRPWRDDTVVPMLEWLAARADEGTAYRSSGR